MIIQGAARPQICKSTYKCLWSLLPSYYHPWAQAALIPPECHDSHQKGERGTDVTVNTLYKNKCICYQGACADSIAMKHAMASQGDSQLVTKVERIWPLEADALINWEATLFP